MMDDTDLLAGFDMLDTATFAQGHPHDLYDRLRVEAPVLRHPGSAKQPDFWVLSRYEDINAVSRDNRRFTSTRGFRLATDRRLSLDPEIGQTLARFTIAMDPPEHAAHRALINPAFTAGALAGLEEGVRASVVGLMDSLAGADVVEFVTEVAATIPIKTICAMLGVPPQDEGKVFRWTNGIFGTDDPDFALSVEDSNRNYLEIFDYGLWLLDQRRAEPRDDLMTIIAHAQIHGEPMEARAQKSFFSNILAAGNETTRSSLSGSVLALARNPDQRARLVADPGLVGGAVNELLRFYSPVYQMMRTAKEDLEIGGQSIAAGERVVMLYGSGNHDPAVFEDPHALDVTRANAVRHLSYGAGAHHCVGSRLASMQLRIILEEFLPRFPAYEVIGEPAFVATNFVASIKSMQVRLHA